MQAVTMKLVGYGGATPGRNIFDPKAKDEELPRSRPQPWLKQVGPEITGTNPNQIEWVDLQQNTLLKLLKRLPTLLFEVPSPPWY